MTDSKRKTVKLAETPTPAPAPVKVKLEGFQAVARNAGAVKTVASSLPVEWPAVDQVANVLFEAYEAAELDLVGQPLMDLVALIERQRPVQTQVSADDASSTGEKPTVAEAQSNPNSLAGKLGIDPTMFLLMLSGGAGDKAPMIFNQIKVATLLEMYDPEEPDNMGGAFLIQRFGEQPIIAFKPGTRDVAVTESANYITDRRRGFEAETSITVDGKLARLYPVGVIPLDFVEEDPMYPGQALRRGVSRKNRRDYTGMPIQVRQLMRIMVTRGDFNPDNRSEARDVYNLAKQGFAALAAEYQDAELDFSELEPAGNLPKLKSLLGQGGPSDQQPFPRTNR